MKRLKDYALDTAISVLPPKAQKFALDVFKGADARLRESKESAWSFVNVGEEVGRNPEAFLCGIWNDTPEGMILVAAFTVCSESIFRPSLLERLINKHLSFLRPQIDPQTPLVQDAFYLALPAWVRYQTYQTVIYVNVAQTPIDYYPLVIEQVSARLNHQWQRRQMQKSPEPDATYHNPQASAPQETEPASVPHGKTHFDNQAQMDALERERKVAEFFADYHNPPKKSKDKTKPN